MKKKQIIGIYIILFLGVTAAGVFASGKQEPSRVLVSEGEITYLEGTVTVNGKPADFGTKVESGDVIRTEASSYCDIVFGKKNIFQLQENTIAKLDFSGANIQLESGSLAAVFDRLSSVVAETAKGFSIASPQVVGGVRGTSFFFRVESDRATYVCTCYGKIRYNSSDRKVKKVVTAYHHKAYRYIDENGKIRVESAGLLYHDDKSMEALAAKIDETINWGSKPAYGK